MVAVVSLEWQDVMDGNFSVHPTRQAWREAVMEVAARAKAEAPASANVHVVLAGRKVQMTVRDVDEGRLLAEPAPRRRCP